MNNNTNNMSNNTNNMSNNNNKPSFPSLIIPMLSIKDIIIGSIGTVIPWVILLFIIGFLIII